MRRLTFYRIGLSIAVFVLFIGPLGTIIYGEIRLRESERNLQNSGAEISFDLLPLSLVRYDLDNREGRRVAVLTEDWIVKLQDSYSPNGEECEGSYTKKTIEGIVHCDLEMNFPVSRYFVSDFASVPLFVSWLVRPFGAHSEAAVLHDWLYAKGNRKDESLASNGAEPGVESLYLPKSFDRRDLADLVFFFAIRDSRAHCETSRNPFGYVGCAINDIEASMRARLMFGAVQLWKLATNESDEDCQGDPNPENPQKCSEWGRNLNPGIGQKDEWRFVDPFTGVDLSPMKIDTENGVEYIECAIPQHAGSSVSFSDSSGDQASGIASSQNRGPSNLNASDHVIDPGSHLTENNSSTNSNVENSGNNTESQSAGVFLSRSSVDHVAILNRSIFLKDWMDVFDAGEVGNKCRNGLLKAYQLRYGNKNESNREAELNSGFLAGGVRQSSISKNDDVLKGRVLKGMCQSNMTRLVALNEIAGNKKSETNNESKIDPPRSIEFVYLCNGRDVSAESSAWED